MDVRPKAVFLRVTPRGVLKVQIPELSLSRDTCQNPEKASGAMFST